MAATAGNGATIDVLTTLCRRELAFVESYRQALNALSLREHSAELATCLRSHEQRAELLKSRIRALHAEPPATGGVLGAVAKLLEGAAAAIGEKAGIMALEEEEDASIVLDANVADTGRDATDSKDSGVRDANKDARPVHHGFCPKGDKYPLTGLAIWMSGTYALCGGSLDGGPDGSVDGDLGCALTECCFHPPPLPPDGPGPHADICVPY